MEFQNNTASNQQGNNTATEGVNNTSVSNPASSGQQQEKLFTQDDVNRIIGERLSRVKMESSAELRDREQRCSQRELMLDAREKLADAGLPKELLSAINCRSKEELDNSIKTIQQFCGQNKVQYASGYRISTGVSSSSESSGGRSGVSEDSIRKAMGLKG